MTFEYNKKNAKCMWCKRTKNPHPDFLQETIPTKIFQTKKGRMIELCFSCYEKEIISVDDDVFKEKLDYKFETMKLLNL